jgi:hypothetical protein
MKFDAFFSHDRGKLLRDNHALIVRIAEGSVFKYNILIFVVLTTTCIELKRLGLKIWIDETMMEGEIDRAMIKGIDASGVVVVFITERYMKNVYDDNVTDNCRKEFNYAILQKTSARMVSDCAIYYTTILYAVLILFCCCQIAVVMEKELLNTRRWGGVVAMHLGSSMYEDFTGDLDNPDYFHHCVTNLYNAINRKIAGLASSTSSSGSSMSHPTTTSVLAMASRPSTKGV